MDRGDDPGVRFWLYARVRTTTLCYHPAHVSSLATATKLCCRPAHVSPLATATAVPLHTGSAWLYTLYAPGSQRALIPQSKLMEESSTADQPDASLRRTKSRVVTGWAGTPAVIDVVDSECDSAAMPPRRKSADALTR